MSLTLNIVPWNPHITPIIVKDPSLVLPQNTANTLTSALPSSRNLEVEANSSIFFSCLGDKVFGSYSRREP